MMFIFSFNLFFYLVFCLYYDVGQSSKIEFTNLKKKIRRKEIQKRTFLLLFLNCRQ